MAHATAHSERWSAGDPRIPRRVTEWLGPRAWSWSTPPPTGRRVAIVSSRLPRLLEPRGDWLAGLRAALERIHSAGDTIVVAHGSAGSDLVRRGAIRQRSPLIVLRCDESSGEQRGDAISKATNDKLDPARSVISGTAKSGPVSVCTPGPCATISGGNSPPTELAAIPARDRAVVAWADEVIVLALRAGGNLHRLLRTRLRAGASNVVLVDPPNLQSRKARAELIGLSAQLWRPPNERRVISDLKSQMSDLNSQISNVKSQVSNVKSQVSNVKSQIVRCPPAAGWQFLTHTTRSCPGPWPGQSCDEFLDSLLDAWPDANHSALAALRRIIAGRRLVSSGRSIRGGFRVVSFTSVPLVEVPRLRVFRSHRGRWDFEPYGICVRRRWLEARGARAVIYTGNSDWSRLDETEQPFFQYVRQLDSTVPPPDPRQPPIDWSLEREWRHVGDLDLSDVPSDDAILFVPSAADAENLLESSPWPVTVLEQG